MLGISSSFSTKCYNSSLSISKAHTRFYIHFVRVHQSQIYVNFFVSNLMYAYSCDMGRMFSFSRKPLCCYCLHLHWIYKSEPSPFLYIHGMLYIKQPCLRDYMYEHKMKMKKIHSHSYRTENMKKK